MFIILLKIYNINKNKALTENIIFCQRFVNGV